MMSKLIYLNAPGHLKNMLPALGLRKNHMQKIIAVFDSLRFSESTMKYAVYMSRQTKATLVGIFLDDPFYSSFSVFDTIPNHPGIDQETRVKSLKMKDNSTRVNSVKTFETACRAASIRCTVHHDNISVKDLVKETIFADLLIINFHETLNSYPEPLPSSFIRNLLKGTHCPVLLVPETFHPIESIVLLYNGDPSSVLALKMFSYLFRELDDLKTQIVYAKQAGSRSDIPDDAVMKEWVKCHFSNIGYEVLPGDSKEQLLEQLKYKHSGTLIAAGSYQRNVLSMLLHPSLADKLIQNLSNPLFIAHY